MCHTLVRRAQMLGGLLPFGVGHTKYIFNKFHISFFSSITWKNSYWIPRQLITHQTPLIVWSTSSQYSWAWDNDTPSMAKNLWGFVNQKQWFVCESFEQAHRPTCLCVCGMGWGRKHAFQRGGRLTLMSISTLTLTLFRWNATISSSKEPSGILCSGSSSILVQAIAPNSGLAKMSWMKPGEVSGDAQWGTKGTP